MFSNCSIFFINEIQNLSEGMFFTNMYPNRIFMAYRKNGTKDPERTQDPGPYEDPGSYEDAEPYEDPGPYEDLGP